MIYPKSYVDIAINMLWLALFYCLATFCWFKFNFHVIFIRHKTMQAQRFYVHRTWNIIPLGDIPGPRKCVIFFYWPFSQGVTKLKGNIVSKSLIHISTLLSISNTFFLNSLNTFPFPYEMREVNVLWILLSHIKLYQSAFSL